ncbi:MAG: hypothetical protein POELPBGB_01345 [Bacteroidia bacterium]|nr:hypothetical protein [Bacteroidia bacterium]
MWLRCIVAKVRFIAGLPQNQYYPEKIVTLGDHIRKTRLERKLSQLEVGKLLSVDEMSVNGWELNRHFPPARHVAKIISFLGYIPTDWKEGSLGKQLRYARLITGLNQEQLAQRIGCDETNLRVIELDKRTPREETLRKLTEFIKDAFVKF